LKYASTGSQFVIRESDNIRSIKPKKLVDGKSYEDSIQTAIRELYEESAIVLEMVTLQLPYTECENAAQNYKKWCQEKENRSLDLKL
jgi:hypothetical protein